MSFYQDMVEGLKNMIGPGKKFVNPTQMAKACDVAPNQIIRYIRQERGKHIQVIARVLDSVGAKIIFPDEESEKNTAAYHEIPLAIAKPDSINSGLTPDIYNEGILRFNAHWLKSKGDPEQMKLLTVTGASMSPRIEDGDRIIVDESQKELFEGRIYAIRIDSEIVIRRIAKEPGKIILVSDNQEAEVRRIALEIKDESIGWAAIGRVVYVAKDLL
ncbi:S24 family peptidase [Maridesulfovibrio zosterae]|uniref:S24 family peptidase n=1 Tax=Maridesulfovibrio zosterae TaxID=82171 RepID=UPI00040F92B8|nr:S24 family peptidase [Maridesulfovibrio zosterae]